MNEDLYRGFIQLKNKDAIEKFKDVENLASYRSTERWKEYAGVLAPGIVLVDIDNMEQSDLLLRIIDEQSINCCVVETGRGKHFLFKDPGLPSNKTKTSTAIGMSVDIKLGTRNSYQVLKHANIKRPWIRKPDTLDELPYWLMPVKSSVDFSVLAAGEGRNQSLFNYILTLQSADLSKDEIKRTITLLNEYILPDPLDERELNVILRDEAFKKQSFFTNSGTFLHDRFAQYIKRENHIIKLNNVLHVYKDGVYSDRQAEIEAAMIKHLPQLNQAKRRETVAYLDLIADRVDPAPVHYICIENGIYDLDTDQVVSPSPDIIIKNRVPVAFDPTAYDETTDRVLDKISCNDPDLRSLLEEMIGYTLLRRNELGKCFILTGSGSNGKSTLIDMLKFFLGSDNYSSLALDEIGERFKTAEVFGKLANLGDDISSQYIDNNATFKKLVTGESVNVERKGKDPFEFNNYGKMIFAANSLPRINDTTDGLIRRLVIVPFNAKFSSSDDDFDPFIKDKLLTAHAMQYLLNLAIAGLKRVLANKSFTMPEVVAAELKQYEEFNNPVLAFLNSEQKVENEPTNEVYLRYSVWSHENGLKPMGAIHFSRSVCKQMGYITKLVRIEGKRVYIFTVS